MGNKSEILIYKTEDNQTEVQVQFENETVWLSQKLMAKLFEKDSDTIGLHIKNIFDEKEVEENSTTEYFSVVQKEGGRNVSRKIKFYNLDVILSVGYRVNSKKGTQFRQWATQLLKKHLVKGYTLNESRLKKNLNELENAIMLIKETGKAEGLHLNEAKGLLDIIASYTQSFVMLNKYDSNNLETEKLSAQITYEIKYNEAKTAIYELKKSLIKQKQASDLFGNEKDESFKGILGNIVQTFGGKYLYKSIEEQAAYLLYFVIKNHPFSDGNKRIGAFLFIWFLEKNRYRFKANGELKINDNALTALALLVAQSNPSDKELMVKLTMNLISR